MPDKDSFFHGLGRAGGSMYILSSDRSSIVDTIRQELKDSLNLPNDPTIGEETNYEAFGFKMSEEEVGKKLLESQIIEQEIAEYIARYLGIEVEVMNEFIVGSGSWRLRLIREGSKYSLIVKVGSDGVKCRWV